jgi:hypothetical protein
MADLTNIVYDYLSGADIADVKSAIIQLCHQENASASYLCQQITLSAAERERLFEALNVPPAQHARYAQSTTLFVLLKRLHQDGYGYNHLEYLLQRINQTQLQYFWRYITIVSGLTLVAVVSTVAYHVPQVMQFFAQLAGLFWVSIILKNSPFIGVIYNFLGLLWTLYDTFCYGFANLTQKLYTALFAILTKGSMIAAHLVTVFAASVVTPVAGILFVFSALIDVIETVAHYLSIIKQPLMEHADDRIRQENQKRLVTNTLGIKIAAAILTTVAVSVWCFCPLSFPLVLSMIGAMILIGIIKYLLVSHMEMTHANQLQRDLRQSRLGFFAPAPAAVAPNDAPEPEPSATEDGATAPLAVGL